MSAATEPVLVIGARSDIARAIATKYARVGHPLWLAARNATGSNRDAADLALRTDAEVQSFDLDVTDLAAHDAFLAALPSTPATVVCAVGFLGDQEADAGDMDATQMVVATNFTGPALLLEKLAARMSERPGKSAIIGISSVAGDRGRAKNYVYGSAKAGFSAYLSGLRQKYAATGLQIMTVKPGFVRTSMTDGMDLPGPLTTDPDSFAARVVKAQRAGRVIYYDMRWRVLMSIIRLLPEKIFMKTKF
ncbi:MAG: SDR family oxidoreductase [Pseudomonadota bacterium]